MANKLIFLTVTESNIYLNDAVQPTYTYRGLEIGHRDDAIKNFKKLKQMLLQETGRTAQKMDILTTQTTGTPGDIIIPSEKHGKNVCCRIQFDNGKYGSGDCWVSYKESTTIDGAPIYCAHHCMEYALTHRNFRLALSGDTNKIKRTERAIQKMLNLGHLRLYINLQITIEK